MKFESEEQLMLSLKEQVLSFKALDSLDLAPHQVMSHGFMQWTRMLNDSFPSMGWRGQKREGEDDEWFEDYMAVLFKRFWIRLMQEKMGLGMRQKGYLLVEGWKEFLKD